MGARIVVSTLAVCGLVLWGCATGLTGTEFEGGTATDAAVSPDAKEGGFQLPPVGKDGGGFDAPFDASPNPGGDCLIISEYLEGTGSNKAIEIWNCGKSPISLDPYGLCLTSNTATAGCTATQMLAGPLGPNEVLTVCGTSFTNAACDGQSAVVNFNGDDRIALMRDDNVDQDINRTSDSVVDSFGDLSQQPNGTPWADKTYRRSRCTVFKTGSFDPTQSYTASATDDFSDLGKPPAITCP